MTNETKSEEISLLRKRMHESVDKLMDQAESMNEFGKEEIIHLKEKAVAVKENVDGYIQKNPEKSVLIAAGVGAIVGALITATLMKKKGE